MESLVGSKSKSITLNMKWLFYLLLNPFIFSFVVAPLNSTEAIQTVFLNRLLLQNHKCNVKEPPILYYNSNNCQNKMLVASRDIRVPLDCERNSN